MIIFIWKMKVVTVITFFWFVKKGDVVCCVICFAPFYQLFEEDWQKRGSDGCSHYDPFYFLIPNLHSEPKIPFEET